MHYRFFIYLIRYWIAFKWREFYFYDFLVTKEHYTFVVDNNLLVANFHVINVKDKVFVGVAVNSHLVYLGETIDFNNAFNFQINADLDFFCLAFYWREAR